MFHQVSDARYQRPVEKGTVASLHRATDYAVRYDGIHSFDLVAHQTRTSIAFLRPEP